MINSNLSGKPGLVQGFPTTNPLILFGFNPQPEPPASTAEWRTTETTASRSIDGVSGGQLFEVLIGLERGGELDLTGLPEGTERALLLPAVQKVRLAGTADTVVKIALSTSSGGTPTDIVSFKPQPEPPARFDDFDVWGLQLQVSSLSSARVAFSVDDGTGNRVDVTPVTLAPVPLPPAILLGMGGAGRSRCVAAAAAGLVERRSESVAP